ncbi:MAG: cupin domain-containing protein [Pseudomonadota bacterium]
MSDLPPLKTVIEKLGLIAHHVEGGYFLQTYKAKEKTLKAFLPDRFDGDRAFATSIYYVIPPHRISSLHLMFADEGWHFYLGSPINLVEITPEGETIETILGQDITNGQVPQHTVMHGNWLGAYNLNPDQYSLVGCTVSPGMELDDYRHGDPKELLEQFPHLTDLIHKLTWPDDIKPPPYDPDND